MCIIYLRITAVSNDDDGNDVMSPVSFSSFRRVKKLFVTAAKDKMKKSLHSNDLERS